MDFEKIKLYYQNANKGKLSKDDLQSIINKNTHPLLKKIKRQLIFESVLWAFFLLVYYDFFDGHLKPILWNVLLIVSVVLLLVHNLLGYKIIRNPIRGENLLQSLGNYLLRIRRYSKVSITTRVLGFVLAMVFFISTIDMNSERYWTFGLLALFVPIQIFFLRRIWHSRIGKVKMMYEGLHISEVE